MSSGPAFVVNRAGTVHSVPSEWVMIDTQSASEGAVTVRGNLGYRFAKDDEIAKWHDDQGLDSRTDEDTDTEDELTAQPANFTVEDADGLTVEDPPNDNKSPAKGK